MSFHLSFQIICHLILYFILKLFSVLNGRNNEKITYTAVVILLVIAVYASAETEKIINTSMIWWKNKRVGLSSE